jgi:hypothetical protein
LFWVLIVTNLVGILGDTHGQQRWTRFALWNYAEQGIDTVYQVGDFGFWRSNSGKSDPFSLFVNDNAKALGIRVVVVPGNHEDYDLIDAVPVSDDGWQHYMSNIDIAPRGHRWTHNNVSFVALGGAPSVDRKSRLSQERSKLKLWWAQEAITEEDVARTIEGGYADVMLAHDAPFVKQIQERIARNPFGFDREDLKYAYDGRLLMDKAFCHVKPKLFFHGHYHFPVDEAVLWGRGYADSRVIGLDRDGTAEAIGYLNLDTLEPSLIKHSDFAVALQRYQKSKF